jgi:thymidine phosphorylase
LLAADEAALSEVAWEMLGVTEGAPIAVTHAPALESVASVRRRIYGHRLDAPAFAGIVGDVAAARYTDVHLSAFLTACAVLPLDEDETIDLTAAMTGAGDRLSWGASL